jgi:hypothetical protein
VPSLNIGVVASSVGSPPSITIDTVTNFNQNIATFNATVNPNGSTTSVKFQYKKTADSTWTDGATISGLTGGSQSVYSNQTGLNGYGDNGGIYDVRALATNSIDTTTSGTASFTTWALQYYERSTSGGTTFTIPTVTPTGGSAVSVSIYDIIMFGGGGGGGFVAGGGGGASQNISSRTITGSRSVTTSVGAGGNAWTSSSNSTVGSSSTISGDLTTATAAGGGSDTSSSDIAGSSGNGNAGGSNAQYDPDGGGKGLPNTAYGGGGGAGGVGGNGVANASTTTGGNGGTGVSITSGGVTRAGGAGGGGTALALGGGPAVSGSQGSNNTYGSGGNGGTNGQDGYIRFRYYAASALA